jgi:hypothetical protein
VINFSEKDIVGERPPGIKTERAEPGPAANPEGVQVKKIPQTLCPHCQSQDVTTTLSRRKDGSRRRSITCYKCKRRTTEDGEVKTVKDISSSADKFYGRGYNPKHDTGFFD